MSPTTLRVLRTSLAVAVVSACLSVALGATPSVAAAQDSAASGSTIEASPKGTVGLGLVGAEVGLVLPAAFGITDLWATITFPVLGAAGGAVAGYYLVDQGSDNGTMGVAMLTTGIVLAIPSLVLAMSLGRYDPESESASLDALRDRMTPAQRARADAGPGLVRLSEEGMFVAAPAIEVGTAAPAAGGGQRVRVAVLSGSF